MPPHFKEEASINPLFDAAKKLQVKKLKQRVLILLILNYSSKTHLQSLPRALSRKVLRKTAWKAFQSFNCYQCF